VIPVLYYPDPREAAAWLSKAFGFKVRLRIGENHRVQMKAGDGCLVVAEGTVPETEAKVSGGHAVMVRIEDAFAHCQRARAAGARILTEPVEHMYGERQYNAQGSFRPPLGLHGDRKGRGARGLGRRSGGA